MLIEAAGWQKQCQTGCIGTLAAADLTKFEGARACRIRQQNFIASQQ
jgi:hypothetical protein